MTESSAAALTLYMHMDAWKDAQWAALSEEKQNQMSKKHEDEEDDMMSALFFRF